MHSFPLGTAAAAHLGPEAVVGHDPEVGEEAGGRLKRARIIQIQTARACLNHANLAVCQRDQSLIDELVVDGVARLAAHQIRLGLFVRERDGGHLECVKRA